MMSQRPNEVHPAWEGLHEDVRMAWRDAMMTQIDDAPQPSQLDRP